MKTYQVEWSIEIDADTPREAAEKALAIQRDPFSTATFFQMEDPDTGVLLDVDLEEVAE